MHRLHLQKRKKERSVRYVLIFWIAVTRRCYRKLARRKSAESFTGNQLEFPRETKFFLEKYQRRIWKGDETEHLCESPESAERAQLFRHTWCDVKGALKRRCEGPLRKERAR